MKNYRIMLQILLSLSCVNFIACSPTNIAGNEPTIPCSYADMERIIALSSMGYVKEGAIDLNIFFGKDAVAKSVNAKAHAKAMLSYKGYLASLSEQGKISEKTLELIMNNIKSMDRCPKDSTPQ